MTNSKCQQGFGLIEVLVAVALLMVAAGAIVSMQSNSIYSAHHTRIHFSIDRLSNEMLETLRSSSVEAAAGLMDVDPSAATSTVDSDVENWGVRVAEQLPSGEGEVSCTPDICDVTISWMEEIDDTYRRQFYNTRTRL